MQKILILGANSAIAQATARRYANEGAQFYLLGRNKERLEMVANDLRVRGAKEVDFHTLDANEVADHASALEAAIQSLGQIDILLIAHGTLPDQVACQASVDETVAALQTNAMSVIAFLTLASQQFEKQGQGSIVAISSVAGDRGRQSNYVYGSAKAAVSIFLQGLRNRLHRHGVQVLTVKPGFVDTPMTAAFDKGPLWVQPEKIAEGIHRAIDKNKDVVYLPRIWWLIMLVICRIPERIFKRLSL